MHAFVDLAAAPEADRSPVSVDLSPGHAGLRVKEISPPSLAVRPARPPRKPAK
jgi:hypothetical protein